MQQYEQRYRETVAAAKQKAAEAAETAADAVSTGALFSAISLLLGAVAAWFGGRWGTVEPTITRQLGTRFGDRFRIPGATGRSSPVTPSTERTAVEIDRTPTDGSAGQTGSAGRVDRNQ